MLFLADIAALSGSWLDPSDLCVLGCEAIPSVEGIILIPHELIDRAIFGSTASFIGISARSDFLSICLFLSIDL